MSTPVISSFHGMSQVLNSIVYRQGLPANSQAVILQERVA